MLRRKVVYSVLEAISIAVASVFYIATIVTNALAGVTVGNGQYGFENQTGRVSDKYNTEVTPAGWAFSIWGVIYTWQALWLIYAWSFVFRPNVPRTISIATYWLFSLSCVFNITWIYLWGNEFVIAALPFIILIHWALILSLSFTAWQTYKKTDSLFANNWRKADLWATRILVHNGLAFYIAWLSVAWLLNVTIAAQYSGGMSSVDAATLGLSLLLVEIVIWFVLDVTVLDRFTRYIQSNYIVLIIALGAVISAHWFNENQDIRNRAFALALLILVIVLQISKILLTVLYAFARHIKFPKATPGSKSSEKENKVSYNAV